MHKLSFKSFINDKDLLLNNLNTTLFFILLRGGKKNHIVKITILIIILFTAAQASLSQSFELVHDHTNIMVTDLEISADFYENILQLKELETPWGAREVLRFYDIGNGRQIHVLKADKEDIIINKSRHIAFHVADFDRYLQFLQEKDIEFSNFSGDSKNPQIRPDGIRQIYFQDPDGNWFEVNDAKY